MPNIAQKVIDWSFYALFFAVPLVFSASSSELFEYNKMMLTYGLTIIIVAAWIVKMAQSGKWQIRRTPLDIPIALYLVSHLLSTVFSIDPHVSIWGYYSRFHEGLLATISYLALYYAAVSNLTRQHVIKILTVSFVSAAIVAIYGTLEHFGHSVSCLLITGNFGVDCWVQDVKTRVFATLGQPNWMAAYLDILILLSLGLIEKGQSLKRSDLFKIHPLLLPALLFAGLLFTKSRSGLLGQAAGLAVFSLFQWSSWQRFWKVGAVFLLLIVAFGLPLAQTEKYSLENLLSPKSSATASPAAPNPGYLDVGISESGDIRKVVWTGAFKIWQRYPLLGSGVETFAYAYYKDRPVEHNMLSEWDFLYNKAHNEYLNLLATTGTFGFLAYLSIVFVFSYRVLKFTIYNLQSKNNFQIENFKFQIALFVAWVSILVTNFFGFSVVIIGLFFFLIPAFYEILSNS